MRYGKVSSRGGQPETTNLSMGQFSRLDHAIIGVKEFEYGCLHRVWLLKVR